MGLEPEVEILGGTDGYTVVEVVGGSASTAAAPHKETASAAVLTKPGKHLKAFMVNSKGKTIDLNSRLASHCTLSGITMLKYD